MSKSVRTILQFGEIQQERITDEFWSKVDVKSEDECWKYLGSKLPNGYGQFWFEEIRQPITAHRVAYELMIGKIPEGYQIDHLCRNRLCVNPKHLEAVTCQTNLLRGNTDAAKNASQTHCPQGHSYSGKNLYISPRGERICRICRNMKPELKNKLRLREN